MLFSDLIMPNYQHFNDDFKMTGFAKSFTNFFKLDVAEACYRDLEENVVFLPHQYGDLTNMQIAARPLGETYNGKIQRRKDTGDSIILDKLFALFEDEIFISFISKIVGEELYYVRPPTPYRFQRGNYMCLHDDMSDPHHACEVVINFTKDWDKSYGGFSIGGYVARRVPYKTPDELPFMLQRIILDKSKTYYCSKPVFNKLSVLKLSDEYCHGTSMVRIDKSRIVIAAIYASKTKKKTTTVWKGEL